MDGNQPDYNLILSEAQYNKRNIDVKMTVFWNVALFSLAEITDVSEV
jgi:hypothetical protein